MTSLHWSSKSKTRPFIRWELLVLSTEFKYLDWLYRIWNWMHLNDNLIFYAFHKSEDYPSKHNSIRVKYKAAKEYWIQQQMLTFKHCSIFINLVFYLFIYHVKFPLIPFVSSNKLAFRPIRKRHLRVLSHHLRLVFRMCYLSTSFVSWCMFVAQN